MGRLITGKFEFPINDSRSRVLRNVHSKKDYSILVHSLTPVAKETYLHMKDEIHHEAPDILRADGCRSYGSVEGGTPTQVY